jgi:hypothetical protein
MPATETNIQAPAAEPAAVELAQAESAAALGFSPPFGRQTSGSLLGALTPTEVLSLQRTAGNRAVLRVVAARRPVAREAEDETMMGTASKFWGGIKEQAYTWMIDHLRGAQAQALAHLRGQARGLPGPAQVVADAIIDALELYSDLCISLVLAVVGLAVGFVAGISKLVWGLVTSLVGIMKGIVLFIGGIFDPRMRSQFDEMAEGVLSAITNLGPAFRTLVDRWLEKFKAANPDRKTLMIGELTGEIEALIVSIWVGGKAASAMPKVTVPLPAFELAGGGSIGGGAITVAAGGPAAAAGLTSAMASSVDDAAKGGEQGPAKETGPGKDPAKPPPGEQAAKPQASNRPALTADTNESRFRGHFNKHKKAVEEVTGADYKPFKKGQGADLIDDLEKLRASGELEYVGKGTIAKDTPWGYIYRGKGITLIQRQSGEFWTIFRSGEGKDLAIQIIEAAPK